MKISKHLFKSTKVIFDAHQKEYQVYYKNWFFWHHDSCYKYDENPSRPNHYRSKEKAREDAVRRAEAMLETVEVWRGNVVTYY